MQSIINPDWNFGKMGIGGLDDQFSAIFRRAFASRVFPPEVVEQLGSVTVYVAKTSRATVYWRLLMFIYVYARIFHTSTSIFHCELEYLNVAVNNFARQFIL
jgi:hypothetical protein